MPLTAQMLRTHTLAHEIVTRDKNAVFDDEYLDQLERFVSDPSESNKQEMMAEFGWGDDGGSRPGKYACCFFGLGMSNAWSDTKGTRSYLYLTLFDEY